MLQELKIQEQKKKRRTEFMQFVLLPALVITIVLVVKKYVVDGMVNKNTTASQVDYILEHVTGTGELWDPSGDIRMNDPKTDIRLYVEDGELVQLKFGLVIMEWSWSEFWREENTQKLLRCGFEVNLDVNDRLKMRYLGEEVERRVDKY